MPKNNLEELRQDLNVGTGAKVYESDINSKSREFLVKKGLKLVRKGAVLEMGWMGPFWTQHLLDMGCTVDIVEGSDKHAEMARSLFAKKGVTVHKSLFEEFTPPKKYDSLLCTGVLKHCPDAPAVLKRAQNWIHKDSHLIIGEPNARSLNRRLGTIMGILRDPSELTENDKAVHNLKIYDRYQLLTLAREAGYAVHDVKGVFFKPFNNEKMNSLVGDQKLLDALDQIGDELIDYSWYLLLLCKKA